MHVGSPRKRPRWLKSDWVLGEVGEADTGPGPGRRAYRMALEKRAVEERGGGAIEEGMLKGLPAGLVLWFRGIPGGTGGKDEEK